jgi:hypothetical protein
MTPDQLSQVPWGEAPKFGHLIESEVAVSHCWYRRTLLFPDVERGSRGAVRRFAAVEDIGDHSVP